MTKVVAKVPWFAFSLAALLAIRLAAARAEREDRDELPGTAWRAWAGGDVDEAERIARELLEKGGDRGEAHHLLFLSCFARGKYAEALRHYADINPAYPKVEALSEPALEAQLHLGRYAAAREFAESKAMPSWRVEFLARRAAHPLAAALADLCTVPFSQDALADYLPGFEVEINGAKATAHIDTGGTFLLMAPHRAKELGIDLTEGGEGFHGARKVKLSHGMAGSFKLGEARLENVPVTALPSLVGGEDFIIFGTNVLEQFFSTLDYPNKRLILSPRGILEQRERHLAMLARERTKVPFYLWGDHYMFVRGSVGGRRGLNFFVDSGLLVLVPDGKGGRRQAAFTTSKEKLRGWGFTEEQLSRQVFESDQPLAIGGLEQSGLLFMSGKVGDTSFGGVRIDGLISHAFLKQYAWTLDFSNGEYIFSR